MGEREPIKEAAESLAEHGKGGPSGIVATLQNINKSFCQQGTVYGGA